MVNFDSLLTGDWQATVAALGGAEFLSATARDSNAFVRARAIANAVDLLRLVLAYCLGERGLRPDLGLGRRDRRGRYLHVGLLWRLQRCEAWLAHLVLGRDIIHSVINPLSRISGAIHVYDGDFLAMERSMWDAETLEEKPYDQKIAVAGMPMEHAR